MKNYAKQSGAALITSLMLLSVLTLLSVSVMSTSRMQMSMTANVQNNENAFQLAQSAGDRYVSAVWKDANCVNDQVPGVCDFSNQKITHGGKEIGTISATNVYSDLIEKCPTTGPGDEYTLGTFQSFHFEVSANGTTNSARGGESVQRQGWFVCRLLKSD